MLFARAGVSALSGTAEAKIEAQTVQQIVDRIVSLGEGALANSFARAGLSRAQRRAAARARTPSPRRIRPRARIDNTIVDLGDEIELDRQKPHDLDVVVDRLVLKDGIKGRVTDSVELALKLGEGRLLVQQDSENGETHEPIWLSERFACVDCGISLPPIEPRMFSFNGPHGACPACDGLGSRTVVDPERVVGDPERTLREGVMLAWGSRASVALAAELARATEATGVDPDVAWRDLPPDQRNAILFGLAAKGKRRTRTSASCRGFPKRGFTTTGRTTTIATTIPTQAKAQSPTTSSDVSASRENVRRAKADVFVPKRSP